MGNLSLPDFSPFVTCLGKQLTGQQYGHYAIILQKGLPRRGEKGNAPYLGMLKRLNQQQPHHVQGAHP